LLLRNPFLLTQPVAVRRRLVPCHSVHRTIAGRGVFLLDRVTAPEPEKLLHRHFPGSNGETPIDPTLVTLLTLAHPEHTPSRHNHHRLSLAVAVPLHLSSRLAARHVPYDFLQPRI